MRPDKIESKVETSNSNAPTFSDRTQSEWKMLQDTIEPFNQSVVRNVNHACENPEETAKEVLGVAVTAGMFIVALRVPALSRLAKVAGVGGAALYGCAATDVLSPAVDTWNHPRNFSSNGIEMGDKAGRLFYETALTAIAGGIGVTATRPGNLQRVANLLSVSKIPAVVGLETGSILPVVENKSPSEFFAKMNYAVSEVPPTTELSGRVFPPHTTDSLFAKEGDIRIRCDKRENGSGYRGYTDVRTAKGQWVSVDFFENKLASLYFADNPKTIIQKSDQLINWLQSYKGKVVKAELKEQWGCAQYQLLESHRPTAKQLTELAAEAAAERLPVHLDFSGNCRFGVDPPSIRMEDGSVWFSRSAGTKGKALVADWEPHVKACGQWITCKMEPGTLKADLLHFSSEPQSHSNSDFISDAMQKGKFSFELLGRDTDPKSPPRYLFKKMKE